MESECWPYPSPSPSSVRPSSLATEFAILIYAFAGALPGAIVLALLGVLTTWSGYVIGQFKLKHRSVFTFGDVGEILWGPVGREALGLIYLVCAYHPHSPSARVRLALALLSTDLCDAVFIAISAAGLLGTQIALNTVSERGTCALVFIIVPAVVVFIFASIQTLNKISILGWIGLVSVFAAVMTMTIAVGVQDRPSAAPQTGPWEKMLEVVPTSTTFAQAAVAVSNVLCTSIDSDALRLLTCASQSRLLVLPPSTPSFRPRFIKTDALLSVSTSSPR